MQGPMGADPSLLVSQRLIIGKHRATVRYIGPVDGQAGEWIGLEWDDISRGKHNGTYEGKRYFECATDHPAGSFVRLAKLLEAASFGQTVATAAAERYSQQASEPADSSSQGELYVSTTSNRRVPILLVGADSHPVLAQTADVRLAALVDMQISQLGSPEAVASILGNITDLDLSINLIGSWDFVIQLATALPNLSALNLSDNVLAMPSLNGSNPGQTAMQLTNLRTLVLNRCRVIWAQVVEACSMLPNLIELHVCGNGISSLAFPAIPSCDGKPQKDLCDVFRSLEVLDLEENSIRSWGEVQVLGALPALRSLQLSNNPIQTITYPGKGNRFSALQSLTLGNTKVDTWTSVDQLDIFPALQDVRLSDTPLTSPSPTAARYEVIARVSKLKTLNGSTVSDGERWDAELTYLRHIVNQLANLSFDTTTSNSSTHSNTVIHGFQVQDHLVSGCSKEEHQEAILKTHPRFTALTGRYGQLTPAGNTGVSGSTLSSNMVEVVLVYRGKEMKKKLPVSLTVGKLKLLIEKLHRVKAAEQTIKLINPNQDPGDPQQQQHPEDISNEDGKELRMFDLITGCRIEVGREDPKAKAAALQKVQLTEQEAHLQRMEIQERKLQDLRAEEQRLMVGNVG